MKRQDTAKLADLKHRVHESLHARIEAAADQNNRTMSAEISAHLTDKLSRDWQTQFNEKILTEFLGPPELRLLSRQLVGAFANAAQQYARSNKLEGSFVDWNNNEDCWEAGSIATILALAAQIRPKARPISTKP